MIMSLIMATVTSGLRSVRAFVPVPYHKKAFATLDLDTSCIAQNC